MTHCRLYFLTIVLLGFTPVAFAYGSGFSIAAVGHQTDFNHDLDNATGYTLEARYQSVILPPNLLTGRASLGNRYIATAQYRDYSDGSVDRSRLSVGVGSISAGVFRSGAMIRYLRYDHGIPQAMIAIEPMLGVRVGPVTVDSGVKLSVRKFDETRMYGGLVRGSLRVSQSITLLVDGDVEVLTHDEGGGRFRMRTMGAGLRYTF